MSDGPRGGDDKEEMRATPELFLRSPTSGEVPDLAFAVDPPFVPES